MAIPISDVETVFQDLTSAKISLDAARDSPVAVRRSFAQFVVASQQLTAAMRREYSRKTDQRWEASDFKGWTDVTELFKALRNADQHEAPVQILVHEAVTARTDLGALITLEGTWELHDQLAERPPEGLVIVRADPATGEPSDSQLPLVARTYRFLLHGRTPQVDRLLDRLGTRDVHQLVTSCYSTLIEYIEYFRGRIA